MTTGMQIAETEVSGVMTVRPRVFADDRGSFMEVWRQGLLAELGHPDLAFLQENRSVSRAGVLRGIHYQVIRPQGKLVRCLRGRAWDVAVDLRRSSESFGSWTARELSAQELVQLWIPPGFGHGFLALEPDTEIHYSCTDVYLPEHDRAVAWNDPELAIDWPLEAVGRPSLSAKDRSAPTLPDAELHP